MPLHERVINFEICDSWFLGLRAEKLLRIFNRLLVVRCEYLWHKRTMEYTAINFANDLTGDVDVLVRLSPLCEILNIKFEPRSETPAADGWRCLKECY